MFFGDVAVEVGEADAEILLHQSKLRIICLIITVFVGTTAVVLDVFVDAVLGPIFEGG